MKNIKLTKDLEAIVDDEDYEYLNQWNWYAQSCDGKLYAARSSKRKTILLHKEILKTSLFVDHINSNTLDNRKENLREVTNSQNKMNSIKRKTKSSKHKGVHWHTQSNKFRVKITLNDKQIHVGYFNNEEDAAKAYNRAAIKYFGKYARINKV